MEGIKKYYKHMIHMRYFIAHLVTIGLKNQFRRSKLGILWTFISPLCLTAIMGVVFSVAFHYELQDYLPYVLSGILFWDIFSKSFIAGSSTIIGYDSFIRQCNHPITLYTLSNSLLFTTSFLISMIALAIMTVFRSPLFLICGIISLPITIVIYAIFAWSGTTISSFIGVQFRDFPMAATLILQVLWYLSPVFLQESLFASNPLLFTWFNINPITHMLNLIRKPFLYGCFPSLLDYAISCCFTVLMVMVAYYVNKKKEKTAIFYL